MALKLGRAFGLVLALLVVPGAANALAARVIQDCGFEAVYVTGAGIANSFLGVPDIGLVTLPELAGHVAAIHDVVELPLIVDADTGFGNALGVQRCVRLLERAGAAAQQSRRSHTGQRNDTADRQIDPAGNDDQRHADGHDQQGAIVNE